LSVGFGATARNLKKWAREIRNEKQKEAPVDDAKKAKRRPGREHETPHFWFISGSRASPGTLVKS